MAHKAHTMARKKLCTHPQCKAVIPYDGDARCEKHTAPKAIKQRLDHHYIDGRYIYHTKQWRRIRAVKIKLNPYCQHCARHKRATPAAMVDHIVPIEHGGDPFNIDNTQSLCNRCHAIKTAEDNRKYK